MKSHDGRAIYSTGRRKNLIWKNYYLLATLELSRVRINNIARTVYCSSTYDDIFWPPHFDYTTLSKLLGSTIFAIVDDAALFVLFIGILKTVLTEIRGNALVCQIKRPLRCCE